MCAGERAGVCLWVVICCRVVNPRASESESAQGGARCSTGRWERVGTVCGVADFVSRSCCQMPSLRHRKASTPRSPTGPVGGLHVPMPCVCLLAGAETIRISRGNQIACARARAVSLEGKCLLSCSERGKAPAVAWL